MLPIGFEERMKRLLGEEYGPFHRSYEENKYQALRLNPAKTSPERFAGQVDWRLTPVPWCGNGFYYEGNAQPGKHPYHSAGVYYMQEPSAMAPAAYLEARPGERVLDLCAAPGGKSTQIAADMAGEGLLVCNEIHPARAKILSENVERMGIGHALVTNETPERLAERLGMCFHRVMVDAPCSGEGMFRKNPEAMEEWSPEQVELCARRQDGILIQAADMLLPGGRMVYSTCTFAPEENEGTVMRFLETHPDFTLEHVEKYPGMEPGRPDWTPDPGAAGKLGLERAIRLFPHRIRGEGHFVAVFTKAGSDPGMGGSYAFSDLTGKGAGGILSEREVPEYAAFRRESLTDGGNKLTSRYILFGEQLYRLPERAPDLKGLKVLRPGLHLGTLKKGRFEPAHALALYLKPEEARYRAELTAEDPRTAAYLRGETFPWEGEKGWYLICVDGYSLGWGKLAGGVMKNHYPKGLRQTGI